MEEQSVTVTEEQAGGSTQPSDAIVITWRAS